MHLFIRMLGWVCLEVREEPEQVLSFCHVGPEDGVQVVRLGDKSLCPPNHVTGPLTLFWRIVLLDVDFLVDILFSRRFSTLAGTTVELNLLPRCWGCRLCSHGPQRSIPSQNWPTLLSLRGALHGAQAFLFLFSPSIKNRLLKIQCILIIVSPHYAFRSSPTPLPSRSTPFMSLSRK